MNVYKLVMIDVFLELVNFLIGMIIGFVDKMIVGLMVNDVWMKEFLDNFLMMVIVLLLYIGYYDVVKIV